MAKVTITIEDLPDGDVRAVVDPPLMRLRVLSTPSPAERYAMRACLALSDLNRATRRKSGRLILPPPNKIDA